MRGRGLLSGHARGCACPGAGRGCLRLRSGPDPSLADPVGERASERLCTEVGTAARLGRSR